MPSISGLSLRIPARHPTFIDLDLPLASLIGIISKRKKLPICTQETTRAKLERLQSEISTLRFGRRMILIGTMNSHTIPHYGNMKSRWREQRKSSHS
jgi:hypothetical protein